MTEQIQFELVSPEEKLVSEPVRLAVIPGEEGEFGVGAGHESLVASLKAGVVKLYQDSSDEPRAIFIAGGFADVTGQNCTVLAEEAVNVNDLDRDVLEQQIRDLNEDLVRAEDEAGRLRVTRRIELATAKLQAASR